MNKRWWARDAWTQSINQFFKEKYFFLPKSITMTRGVRAVLVFNKNYLSEKAFQLSNLSRMEIISFILVT